jgi:RND family efflux transporter MFP subunit
VSARALGGAAALGLVVAAALVLALVLAKRHHVAREARARRDEAQAGPRVMVVPARAAPPTTTLDLQGEVRPWLQTTLYAKLPGFLRDVRVDKGDRVRAGETVARVESPETDRQVAAARANAFNKDDIARRSLLLATRQLVAAQDAESAAADARVAGAQLGQLAATHRYELVRAPFDGVVVARYADPGALLEGTGSGLAVIAVARNERLRVWAYVDERDAARVRVGDPARVRFASVSEPSAAQVTRVAGALDPRTRMLLVEIELENARQIVPGGFADVALTVSQPPAVEIPADALIVRGERTRVAIVDAGDRVRLRAVEVRGNDGVRALVTSGVQPGERVALGLGQGVPDGARVQPVAAEATR